MKKVLDRYIYVNSFVSFEALMVMFNIIINMPLEGRA